ncbi:riboflavin synthase [Candidatus Magnetominusculus dajiuhuensis]|uniref:riboflavin synthase n=1 Tax=Candidatus Magnetominusculus dajiuhuensis TaxID=3137712 RepID=UPI003B43122E
MKRKHGVTELVVTDAVISQDAQVGDSVSVDGVCLTVAKREGDKMFFDVSDETQKSSGAGDLRPGAKVNLEPAMAALGRFGGHFVTGHIDGTGTIESKRAAGGGVIEILIQAPPVIQKYIVKKGSIAVDGVSLTVADVWVGGFSIVIIPHTSGVTTLGAKNRGDSVNLETDIIGKYVEKFVAAYSGNSAGGGANLLNKLREEGFTR